MSAQRSARTHETPSDECPDRRPDEPAAHCEPLMRCRDRRLAGVAEIEMRIHTERQFGENDVQEGLLRTIRPEALASIHPFPLAQQFVSRLVMAGHAKAARADDAHFLQVFGDSAKWLRFGGG